MKRREIEYVLLQYARMEYGKATKSYVKLMMHLLLRDATLILASDIDPFPLVSGNTLLILVCLAYIMTL